MYKWDSMGMILHYSDEKNPPSYTLAAIIGTGKKSVSMWRGVESQNVIKIPYPEGMEFGPELRKYVVMQHKLMK